MTETGKDEYTSDEVVVYGEQLYSERPSQESVELDTLSSGTGSMADADLIITKEDGATAWVKKTASKLWDYIKGKIGISNGGSANKFLNEQGTFTVVNSGKVYDVEMDSTNENMTLTEDGTDKTTLPLVATFVGTHQEWNALSAAEQAKYRRVDFTDDGGFGTAYQVPYGNSNVGDTLTDLNSALNTVTTLTPTYSACTYVDGTITQNNKHVCGNIRVNLSTSISSNNSRKIITGLPKPKGQVSIGIFVQSFGAQNFGWIDTDGALTFYSYGNLTTANILDISFSYHTA